MTTPIFLLSGLIAKFSTKRNRAKFSSDGPMTSVAVQNNEYGRYLTIFDGRVIPLSKAWFNKSEQHDKQ
jgi:hypothetical protein